MHFQGKYCVSAMCKCLGVSRSSFYNALRKKKKFSSKLDIELEEDIILAFKSSKKCYGTRRIKHVLNKKGIVASRRRIGAIMRKFNLCSLYNKKIFRVAKTPSTTQTHPNSVDRQFNFRKPLEVIVSDLTYVRVQNEWHYICIILDLYNREIIGHSSGNLKDAKLVYSAFQSIPYSLDEVDYFHTDRGKEFDNKLIQNLLEQHHIKRSLSRPGTPLDNAVSESTMKALKTEFLSQQTFLSQDDLSLKLNDYVHWWNHHRIHSGINYCTPMEIRL